MDKKPEKPKFAPSGFWLSQRGAVIPVQIHAEALILMPEVFGLSKSPHGKDEINKAMEEVIRSGWVRGRMLSPGNMSFQLWEAREDSVAAVHDFLTQRSGNISVVTVETVDPPGWWHFTFQEFFNKSYPEGWGLGHQVGARSE